MLDLAAKFLPHVSTDAKSIHAVLLLLSRLTRLFPIAQRLLKTPGTLQDLVRLPACQDFPGESFRSQKKKNSSDPSRDTGESVLITIVLRHLMEDEATLTYAMETEIKNSLSTASGWTAKNFLTNFAPLAHRNPNCLIHAAENVCRLSPAGNLISLAQPAPASPSPQPHHGLLGVSMVILHRYTYIYLC
jgi:hypothetical protein